MRRTRSAAALLTALVALSLAALAAAGALVLRPQALGLDFNPLTDGLVLVVSAESTARHAALRSVDQIRAVNGKVLGVILNRVDLQRHAYYYGHYYGEYYRAYYSSDKKEPAAGPEGRSSRRM